MGTDRGLHASCERVTKSLFVQVYRSIRRLVRCARTCEEVERRLPDLKNFFHDVHEKVRHEFISLLLFIKEVGAFPFYNAVPLDHLVARLAVSFVQNNLDFKTQSNVC